MRLRGRPLRAVMLTGVLAVAAAPLLVLPPEEAAAPERVLAVAPRQALPLAGKVVVIDPGHQLGNRNFPGEISRLVDAGGFQKACNTTGTATRGGYPEASFAFAVAQRLKDRLQGLGARVVLTRSRNSDDLWGPCIDTRGRAGNVLDDGTRADLKISIHGDGCNGCGAGFHVIAPPDRAPWTDDIHAPSLRFAGLVRRELLEAGLPRAPYTAGGDGLDIRRDLGTLNHSDVPVAMAELGNMRSRADARRMTSDAGRARYAGALADAVLAYLG